MSGLRIVAVDPRDDAAIDAWHAAYLAAESYGREETATVWQLEEMRIMLQDTPSTRWIQVHAGFVGDEIVVTGVSETPLADNLDRAEVAVRTRPEHRRQGHATALLAHLEQIVRERGRRVLVTEAHWPVDAGPDGAGQPGPAFLAARGYVLALGDVQRRLDLPVDGSRLDDLAAAAAGHHASYRLRGFVGAVPDDLVEGWAALNASLITEAPVGELDVEPESAEVSGLREAEALMVAQGRTRYGTVALDPAGEVVAYTDLVTTVHEPGRVYQWGTLVRRDHRGHRLGVAVKVANLRRLQRERPDATHVMTWNAEVNAPMIGVNEQLGFRPVERLGEFQKRLP